MKFYKGVFLSVVLAVGMSACGGGDDDDEGAGGMGGTTADMGMGAGGMGAGGMGAGGMGAGGMGAGGMGAGGMGAGGMGAGGMGEARMGCEDACNWLSDCAIEICDGYMDDARMALFDGCMTTCGGAPALGVLINTHTMCQESVDVASGANPTFAAGCAGGGPAEAMTTEEAQTWLTASCGPCHTANNTADLTLSDDFVAATVGVGSGQVADTNLIEAGDRAASYLYQKLIGMQVEAGGMGGPMPPAGGLDEADIEAFGLWIDAQ